MSLSVNHSYLPSVTYNLTHTSVKLSTNKSLAFLNYIDDAVDNKNLRLILKGNGSLVDTSDFPIHFIHLFEKELSQFKSNLNFNTSEEEKDFFYRGICNYIDFIHNNFTSLQFFEATVICMTRKCKVVQRLGTSQSELVLDSFKKYKHLLIKK